MTYSDLIDLYGCADTDFCDIEQKEASDLLAAFLYNKYSEKYNNKFIDYLSLNKDKIATFLASKEKSNEEKLKIYDEFHGHIFEALSEHFGDDIDEDIDQSHDEYYSKENHEANEADCKIKMMKEGGDCFIKKLFKEAYHNYNKSRLEYLNTINLVKNFKKNEICQKT